MEAIQRLARCASAGTVFTGDGPAERSVQFGFVGDGTAVQESGWQRERSDSGAAAGIRMDVADAAGRARTNLAVDDTAGGAATGAGEDVRAADNSGAE